MNRYSKGLICTGLLILCSCGQLSTRETDQWFTFTEQVAQLDSSALAAKYDDLLARYWQQPDNQTGLYLSYLLSRPNLPKRDLNQSKALLNEIPADGFHGVLRDSLLAEVELMLFLEAEQETKPLSAAERWIVFLAETETLDSKGIAEKLMQIQRSAEQNELTAEEVALYRGYLLSRPGSSIQDLPASRTLLQQISVDSSYAVIKRALLEHIDLQADLMLMQRKLEGTESQLELLKAIDDDLTETQKQIEQTTPAIEPDHSPNLEPGL